MRCGVTDCTRSPHRRGICAQHYWRLLTHGDVWEHLPIGEARRRLPAEPLINAVERRGGLPSCLHDYRSREGMRLRRAYLRAKQHGRLTHAAADDLAIKLLGLTPGEIWDEVPA